MVISGLFWRKHLTPEEIESLALELGVTNLIFGLEVFAACDVYSHLMAAGLIDVSREPVANPFPREYWDDPENVWPLGSS